MKPSNGGKRHGKDKAVNGHANGRGLAEKKPSKLVGLFGASGKTELSTDVVADLRTNRVVLMFSLGGKTASANNQLVPKHQIQRYVDAFVREKISVEVGVAGFVHRWNIMRACTAFTLNDFLGKAKFLSKLPGVTSTWDQDIRGQVPDLLNGCIFNADHPAMNAKVSPAVLHKTISKLKTQGLTDEEVYYVLFCCHPDILDISNDWTNPWDTKKVSITDDIYLAKLTNWQVLAALYLYTKAGERVLDRESVFKAQLQRAGCSLTAFGKDSNWQMQFLSQDFYKARATFEQLFLYNGGSESLRLTTERGYQDYTGNREFTSNLSLNSKFSEAFKARSLLYTMCYQREEILMILHLADSAKQAGKKLYLAYTSSWIKDEVGAAVYAFFDGLDAYKDVLYFIVVKETDRLDLEDRSSSSDEEDHDLEAAEQLESAAELLMASSSLVNGDRKMPPNTRSSFRGGSSPPNSHQEDLELRAVSYLERAADILLRKAAREQAERAAKEQAAREQAPLPNPEFRPTSSPPLQAVPLELPALMLVPTTIAAPSAVAPSAAPA